MEVWGGEIGFAVEAAGAIHFGDTSGGGGLLGKAPYVVNIGPVAGVGACRELDGAGEGEQEGTVMSDVVRDDIEGVCAGWVVWPLELLQRASLSLLGSRLRVVVRWLLELSPRASWFLLLD